MSAVVFVGLQAVWAMPTARAVGPTDDIGEEVAEAVDVDSAGPGTDPNEIALLESPPLTPVEPEVPEGLFGDGAVLEPEPVLELVELRSASSEVWVNSDGSRSIRSFVVPRYFQPVGSELWQPIDTELIVDSSGVDTPDVEVSDVATSDADARDEERVRSTANRWEVSFGGSTSPEGLQRFDLEGRTVAFSPIGAADVAPVADGSTVIYQGLWPSTDAVYEVSAVGVDERLVLHSAEVPASFEFEVMGAIPRHNVDGGIDLVLGDEVVASVPPLTVETADQGLTFPEAAGAAFEVSAAADGALGGRIGISVDPDWLAGLAVEAFPVVIDPSVLPKQPATYTQSLASSGPPLSGLRVGYDQMTGKVWRARAYVPIPDPAVLSPGGTQPWQLTRATLRVYSYTGYNPLTVSGHGLEPLTFANLASSGQPLVANVSGGTYSLWTAQVTDWVAQHPGAGTWYGLVGNETGNSPMIDLTNLHVEYWFDQTPDPTHLESPTGVVATTTPTLVAVATNDPSARYRFKIGTEPLAVGNVVDSGWISSRTWAVPAGSLADGATYYIQVWTGIHAWDPSHPEFVQPAAPITVKSFTIKKRLGAGGPSPTDTVGAVPGSTQTPSEGSPSPGVAPASVTVNLVTGNLAVALNTHPLSSLSGPAGVTLNYDSLGPLGAEAGGRGLSGRYLTGTTLLGQRVDPAIDFSWPGSPMGGYLSGTTPVTAEWTGTIKSATSVGAWHLGGSVASGTMKIYLDGSSAPYATMTSDSATFGSSLAWAVGTSHSIKIEYTSTGGRGVQLWAWDDGIDPSIAPASFVVPSGWLTPSSNGLPVGWRLSANPYSGSWTRLDDLGNQVVLRSATGETATFTRRPFGGYTPPAGSGDFLSVATVAVPGVVEAGEFTLSNESGVEIVFGRDGWVRSVRTLADDRRPTALRYTYAAVPGTGSTPVLTAITDPVTNRSIWLCYGAASCDFGDYDTSNAPAGMLARISYWDGVGYDSYSTLVYDTSGRFVRLINPGGLIADFGYDSSARLTAVRDPLANDAMFAAQRPDCPAYSASTPTCMTEITYVNGKVATVKQPAPTQGAARTTRTYTYNPGGLANTAQVAVSGFSPASGYATRVKWDNQGRIIEQRDPEQRPTKIIWDPTIERVLSTIDSRNLQTTNLYDSFTHLLTDTYGPAPATCFSTSAPFTPAGACPVTVPRTQHRYDEGITGLAATFWDNPYFAGAPKRHGTGPGGNPAALNCPADTFCTQWNTLPVTPSGVTRPAGPWDPHSFTWSARFTGVFNLAVPRVINTSTSQQVTIYIDDVLYTEVSPKNANAENSGEWGEYWFGPPPSPPTIPAGRHRIRVEYLGAELTTANGLILFCACITSTELMPNNVLSPDYGLETNTIDPDGKTVATSYTDPSAGISAELGLVTAVIQDPAGLALTTTNSYETPSSGRWLRKTASTLPSGTTTSYKHYCATPTSSDCGPDQITDAHTTACGVNTTDSQWGLVAQRTDPAPGPNTPARAEQYLYDSNGRTVGRRVGPADTITSAAWECVSYDGRGNVDTQTWPTQPGSGARSVLHNDAVGGNPLRASIADANGTITSTVDLMGRVASYTDTNNRTTTYAYDQAGRVTTVTAPGSTTTHTYSANSGNLITVQVSVGGQTRADAALFYDEFGRLSGMHYNNATINGSVSYDSYGNQSTLGFTQEASDPPIITTHQVTRSAAGRQVDASVAMSAWSVIDPNPAGLNYVYDGAGRLVTAHLAGGQANYNYGPNTTADSCPSYTTGANLQPGKNTNRAGVIWVPTSGPTSVSRYCYNTADQLVASITDGTPISGYQYDSRGNQTSDGPDTYSWDAASRLAGISNLTTTVSYVRDAVDRPTRRTENGSVTSFGFNGYGDSPDVVINSLGVVVQQLHALPGGVLVTIDTPAMTSTWSYPDLNGHITAISDSSGNRVGAHTRYDPWGKQLAGTIDNLAGNADHTAYGTHGKLQEHATNTPLVLMGARPLNPATGRFLSVDPVIGGCANPYVYGYGDPLNTQDLTGKNIIGDIWGATGGKAVSWFDNNACDIAQVAGWVGTGLAVGAFVASVVATGGTTAAILAAGAASAGAVRTAAGVAAGSRRHKIGGAAQMVSGGYSFLWRTAQTTGPMGVSAALGGATGLAVGAVGAALNYNYADGDAC